MSQTSKVNPSLRQEIVSFLSANGSSTNTNIYFGIPSMPSMRKIQEATQKLTKDGTLVRSGKYFSLPVATGTANAATA